MRPAGQRLMSRRALLSIVAEGVRLCGACQLGGKGILGAQLHNRFGAGHALWQSQLARHVFGDAQGDLLLPAELEDHITAPKSLCPRESDFIPGNAQGNMANAKREENGEMDHVIFEGDLQYIAVIRPVTHANFERQAPKEDRCTEILG